MRSVTQNPFPAPATLLGDQVLSGSCSETASLRLLTGNLNLSVQVVQIPTVGFPLGFHLFYNAQDDVLTPALGHKWQHQYQMRLKFDAYPDPAQVTLVGPDAGRYGFTSGSSGWTRDPGYHFTPASLVEDSLADEWRLEFPGGSCFVFEAVARGPVYEGRLVRLEDRHGNTLSLTWDSSDRLESLTEPTGRSLVLEYDPTTGGLTKLTFMPTSDPADKVVMGTFQVVDDELTCLTGPEGCVQQYVYDSNHRIIKRKDPLLRELSFGYDGSDRLTSVTDAGSPAATLSYSYDTVEEAMGDVGDEDHPTVVALDRTRLLDARGQTWEYRFDGAGNLWRLIDPLGRQVRNYWDGNQRLLYSSVGYPTHHDPSFTRQGPRDNLLNSVWRYGYDEAGNRTHAADPSGQVHSFAYDSEGRVLESVRGLAHLGVQGDWPGTYGEHGWLLCAFESDGEDRQDLPAYVGAVSGEAADPFERLVLADGQDLVDPRVPRDFATMERRIGFWRPVDEGATDRGFTFRVQLQDPEDPENPRDLLHEFNLSLYSHSADQGKGGYYPLTYAEQYGRDLRFTVTDVDEEGASRTRSFRLFNNAAGVWTTFPVRGNLDGSVDVVICVEAAGENQQARLSALAFDPPSDRSHRFTYDSADNLVGVRDGLGGVTGMSYNADGTLDEFVDARNKSTRFAYDLSNFKNLLKIVDPDLKETLFEFDAFGLMRSVQDANLNTTRFTYDLKGRMLTVTTEGNRVMTLDYDEAGNLLSVTDPEDRVTSFTYTAMNRLESVTDPEQGVASFEWDGAGSLAKVTDPRGKVTGLACDQAGQLVEVKLGHDASATTFDTVELAYDAKGLLVSVTGPGGTRPVADVVTTGLRNLLTNPGAEEADPFSSLATRARGWHSALERMPGGHTGDYSLRQWGAPNYPLGHEPTRIAPGVPLLAQGYLYLSDAGVTYAAALRLDQHSLAGGGFTSEQEALERTSGYAPGWRRVGPVRFKPESRTQRPEVSLGLKSEASGGFEYVWWDDLELLALGTGYRHDASGRLAEVALPDGGRYRLRYDRFGNLAESEDAQGRITRFRHDALDRLVEVTDPEGQTHRFSYDGVGNLASFTEPGPGTPTTTYSYDDTGRLATLTYPDTTTEVFSYDDAGRLEGYTDNRGRSFAFTYDGDDRLESLAYPTPNETVEFTYHEAGSVASRTERKGDQTLFTRDDLDRVTRETFLPGPGSPSPAWTHEHEYDGASNRTRLVSGSSAPARYGSGRYGQDRYGMEPVTLWEVPTGGYDARNRLVGFRDGDANETTMTYDGEGRRTSISYPNGVVTTAEYDFLGRLLSLSSVKDSTPLLDLAYAYDANSNRRAMLSDGDRFEYRLDEADRLVGETLNSWSRRTREDFRLLGGTGLDTVGQPGKVQVLGFDDPFPGSSLNVDRWRLANSNLDVRGLDVRVDEGLTFTFPRGFAHRVFAHPPDYQGPTVMAEADVYGLSPALFWAGAEHRLGLEGDFALQVDLDRLQKVLDPAEGDRILRVGLLVRDAPLEQPASNSVGVFRAQDATRDGWLSELRVDGGPLSGTWSTSNPTSAGSLRIAVSNGLVTTSFRESGGSTWTDLHAAQTFGPETPLFVSLYLDVDSGLGTARFRNFARTSGGVYPFWGSNPAVLTSEVFDTGRSGVEGDRISWTENLPPGCDVKFRVAARDTDPDGTWSDSEFKGPDGTAATFYSTPAGEDLHPSIAGRYFRYRANLVTSPTATPDFTELLLTFAGDNPWQDRRYAYDARGNMTGKQVRTASGTTTETRTVNTLNQVTQNVVVAPGGTTTWTYTWDDNGNLATKSDGTEAWTYTFDDDNRLVRVQKAVSGTLQLDVSYTYDSVGRMLTRKLSTDTNPTTFEWDGWDLLREVAPDGTETLYYAPQGEILGFKRGNELYQVHADALGSVRKVTNSSGTAVGSFSYSAWGELVEAGSSLETFYAFLGGVGVRFEGGLEFYYVRARYYDPYLTCFISRDPAGNPNLYTYALNLPVRFIDRNGREPEFPEMVWVPVQDERDVVSWIQIPYVPNRKSNSMQSQFNLNPAAFLARATGIYDRYRRAGLTPEFEVGSGWAFFPLEEGNCRGDALSKVLGRKFHIEPNIAKGIVRLFCRPRVGPPVPGDLAVFNDFGHMAVVRHWTPVFGTVIGGVDGNLGSWFGSIAAWTQRPTSPYRGAKLTYYNCDKKLGGGFRPPGPGPFVPSPGCDCP